MGIFGRKQGSTIIMQAPVVEPPSMTIEQVMQHAGFERGWRAETIWATHQRSGVVHQLMQRYGYAAMPAWCQVDGDSVVVFVDGQQVAQLPKAKVKKVAALGDRVPALATFSGNESAPKLGVHISGL